MLTDNEFKNLAIVETLRAWGFQSDLPKFFCPDGFVVAALLCNAAAKFIDEDFYDYKSVLVHKAIEEHGNCWQDDGVVYFETSVGQLSFHVFDEEDEFLSPANGREWAGGWMQDRCVEIAEAFLDGGDSPVNEFQFSRWLQWEQ